jgi:hypothetical protein
MTIACLPLVSALLAVQGPILGQVVDAQGKPVAGAEVALTAGMSREGTVEVVAAIQGDEAGRFSIKSDGLPRPDLALQGILWAFKYGAELALGTDDLLRNDRTDQVHRIVLEAPKPRKVALRDDAGRPLAGARVAPRLVQTEQGRYQGLLIPDLWLDRLAATTDAQGVAHLAALGRQVDLRTVFVAVPGRTRQIMALPYAAGREDVTLTLAAAGRLTGRVEIPGGPSFTPDAAATTVQVWARCESPIGKGRTLVLVPEPVTFEAGPVRVSADGRFETPLALPRNATYRVDVRGLGLAPAVSSWVRLAGKEAAIPPVVARPLRTIQGRVLDRQGQPIQGVLVVQAGGGPSARTDHAGRFKLAGCQPCPSFLVGTKRGFRCQGVAAGESTPSLTLVLRRADEPHEPPVATLPPPVPLDESRDLARRVLAPALAAALKAGDDGAKLWLLRGFRWLDPVELLEHAEKGRFTRGSTSDFLRGEAALGLVARDPEEAVAVAETIADPANKAGTLVDLVDALSASELPRRLALLERAAAQVRAAKLGSNKFFQTGEVAERYLELGQEKQARQLFDEGRALIEALPSEKRTDAGSFLAHLARLDATSPVTLLKNVGPDRWNQRMLANVASRLAFAFPAEAEHAWELLHETTWRRDAGFRICRRLARRDPDRARRLASRFPDPTERAYAWTFLADGLREIDPTAAREALDHAIEEIDALSPREMLDSWDPGPAASILPLVERISPDRVADVFWRAVAHHAGLDDPRRDLGRDQDPIDEVLLLSRYNRDVAATLFAPLDAYLRSASLRGGANDLTTSTILALACIDPRRAVEAVESLPSPRSPDINDPVSWARCQLGELLAMPADRRWLRLWRFHAGCGIAMFEEVYRDL